MTIIVSTLRFASRKRRAVKAYQSGVSNELSCQPQERFLEVVVGLSGDVVVLEILLSMESDGLGLDFAFLDVDFVAAEDDGDLFADTDQVA